MDYFHTTRYRTGVYIKRKNDSHPVKCAWMKHKYPENKYAENMKSSYAKTCKSIYDI